MTVRLAILGCSKFHIWDCVLVDWLEIIIISLARYAISGQSDSDTDSDTSDRQTDSSFKYRFIRIQFTFILTILWKSMQILFTLHRQGATDYNLYNLILIL